jgi:DNA-binding MarR family transcriptional regulator
VINSTGFLIARAGAESRRRFTQALAAHALTLAQFGVLMVLGELGSAPQRALGDQVGIDPRNLVPIIDELEARRYVRRGPDREDRRRHAVTLTAGGRRLLGQLGRSGARVEAEFLSPLSASERKQLNSMLRKLI